MDRLRLSFSACARTPSWSPICPISATYADSRGSAAIAPGRSRRAPRSLPTAATPSGPRRGVRRRRLKSSKTGLIRGVQARRSAPQARARCESAMPLRSSPSRRRPPCKPSRRPRALGSGCWNAVEKLRAVKDAAELALMREAAVLISDVWTRVIAMHQAGRHRTGGCRRARTCMKLRGASGPSFETIVASGPRSAWAHARPTSKLLRKNELVVLDQGAILRGYCSDMTRTVFLGRAPGKVRAALPRRSGGSGSGQGGHPAGG